MPALSYLCLEDVRRDDLAQACASYIKTLCENSVEVDPQRVEECFKTLIEDGVLDQDPARSFRFRTPLLEHALRARAHNKVLFGAEVHASAARLGLRRVRRPVLDGASDEGSQGSVYAAKHPRRNTSVSVRLVRLAEPSQSEVDLTVLRRFQSEVKVLSRIGSIFRARCRAASHCDRHLPQLVEAGLDESDSRVGVVIYDRIPGQTLLEVSRNEPLDTLAIVTIGFHLASALVALEAAEVVHRDIAARNVVLRAFSDLSERSREDTAIEPVLIDFGLASSVGAGSLIGHVPPEVTSAQGLDLEG
ncbi:MAG: protein kinase [Myxococcales bacterium]|nr:protein kinase [Myxococcales bacterium]